MGHQISAPAIQSWAETDASRRIQFWPRVACGLLGRLPFFRRGWRSVVAFHLNLFTLIAIGVGAGSLVSAVAMHEVPLDQVQVGDRLGVVPGDKLHVDGVVVEGHSSVKGLHDYR
jgi:cation transport ATPase